MDGLILDYDIVMQYPPSSAFFEGIHPLYREGERGELIALVYVPKSDNPFGPNQSAHTMFLVRYADGSEILVPVNKYKRYRVWFD